MKMMVIGYLGTKHHNCCHLTKNLTLPIRKKKENTKKATFQDPQIQQTSSPSHKASLCQGEMSEEITLSTNNRSTSMVT